MWEHLRIENILEIEMKYCLEVLSISFCWMTLNLRNPLLWRKCPSMFVLYSNRQRCRNIFQTILCHFPTRNCPLSMLCVCVLWFCPKFNSPFSGLVRFPDFQIGDVQKNNIDETSRTIERLPWNWIVRKSIVERGCKGSGEQQSWFWGVNPRKVNSKTTNIAVCLG